MSRRTCVLAALGLVVAVPAAADEVSPRDARFSIGLGIGAPQALHLDAGVWVIPELSIEGRLWALPGPLATVTGFEAGLMGHIGSGRHVLLVNAGLVAAHESRHPYEYAPMVGLGYGRRAACYDFRAIVGAGLVEDDSEWKPVPVVTLTWSVRIPARPGGA